MRIPGSKSEQRLPGCPIGRHEPAHRRRVVSSAKVVVARDVCGFRIATSSALGGATLPFQLRDSRKRQEPIRGSRWDLGPRVRKRRQGVQAAQQIAAEAQAFGQEDDITVLTLSYVPAEVMHR